jgi:predicted dinucleotide-binding enzyme
MKIAIVGSDQRAVAVGRLFASGGHDVTFGDASSKERADAAAAALGVRSESLYEQAMTRELLVFAFPRTDLDRTVAALGTIPHRVVVVDALAGAPPAPHRGAELLARKLNSHEVVRALMAVPLHGANVPICGDDPHAKSLVADALNACGCATADRGPLSNAPALEGGSAAA